MRWDSLDSLDSPRLNRLHNCFRQFLHEQRHAVSLGQDLPEQLGGKYFAPGKLGDDGAALRTRELREVQRRHMPVPRPARRKLRPMGQHDQQRNGSHSVDQQVEHFQAGGIGPVRILEQHHRGLFPGRRLGEIDQRSQCLVLVFLWRHRERPVAVVTRYGQHRRDETYVCKRAAILFDHQRFELIELGLRRLVATELQCAFKIVDDWVEGTVDVVGRTLEA